MTDRLDLPDRYRRQLEALLAEHVPDAEAWAYGSRVNGRSHPASDLDLVLRGPGLERIPASRLAELEEAIEQSNIPILIQTHDWARLPTSFHKEIKQQYVVLRGAEVVSTSSTIESSWTEARWGDLVTLEYGRALRNYQHTSGRYRVFGTNGPIGSHDEPLCRHPTVVIGRKGANRGIHYSPDPCFVIDTAFYLKPKTNIDTRWAYYQLLTVDINGMDSGSAIPSTSRGSFYQLPVSVPPIHEQQKIARILGTLDDKIELNRRMSMTLEEMAHALFKSWFVDFDPVHAKAEGRPSGLPPDFDALFPESFQPSELGPIPEGWTVGSLSDIIDQIRDTVEPRTCPSERFTHFSIPAFDSNQTPRHEYGRSIKSHKLVVQPDSILVSRLNPEIERVWLADVSDDQRAVCSTEYLVIRPTTPFSKGYIYCLARSRTFQDRLQSFVTGTSRSHQRVPSTAILSTVVSIPPAPTATMFEHHSRPLLDRSLMCRRQADQLTDARNMLLPELVSGKLSASII